MHGLFRRRRLPHWDVLDGTYFVTACLDGSISALGMKELHRFRDQLDAQPIPDGLSAEDWETRKQKLLFAKLDHMLDENPVVRHFDDVRLADEVRASIYHFTGQRYVTYAWCIMPSHFHWIFRPMPDWCELLAKSGETRSPREVIMHSLKSFTGNQCNRLRQATGTFWEAESYDHWIRDDDEVYRAIRYVEQNPVKARLVEQADQWKYSSAFDRRAWGVATGDPLISPPVA